MGKRKAIHALVLERRAIHKSGICKELGYAWGTVGHHLFHLSKHGRIVLEHHGNRLWAYAPTAPADQRARLAMLKHGRREDVLEHLRAKDRATIRELSDSMEESQRVIRTHLSHLLVDGTVGREGPPPHQYFVGPAGPDDDRDSTGGENMRTALAAVQSPMRLRHQVVP